MSALHSLQRRCIAAFLDDDHDALVNELIGNGLPPATRIRVYQNNAREGFRKALVNAYPVTEKLVGSECFRGLSHYYQQRNPSISGDLQHYGASFVQHISEIYTNTRHAYLADVAELEWAIEMALTGPETETLDLSALSGIDPAQFGDLRFEIAPSIQLIESSFPIVAIWQANQAEAENSIDLGTGPNFVVVRRAGSEVELRLIDETSFLLATCFRAGQTIVTAADTVGQDEDFDLESSLKTLLVSGCLSNFSVDGGSEFADDAMQGSKVPR